MRLPPLRHWVTLANAPNTTPDSDGFYTDLDPAGVYAAIEPQSPGQNGRTLTHLVTMRFHPQVTMDTRILFYDAVLLRNRSLMVTGVQNIENRNIALRCLCEEVVP